VSYRNKSSVLRFRGTLDPSSGGWRLGAIRRRHGDDLNLPTTKAEAEWLTAIKSAGTTSFFIADRTAYPDGKVAMPPYMLERLPHEFPARRRWS
jgi:hypothetical protein